MAFNFPVPMVMSEVPDLKTSCDFMVLKPTVYRCSEGESESLVLMSVLNFFQEKSTSSVWVWAESMCIFVC